MNAVRIPAVRTVRQPAASPGLRQLSMTTRIVIRRSRLPSSI